DQPGQIVRHRAIFIVAEARGGPRQACLELPVLPGAHAIDKSTTCGPASRLPGLQDTCLSYGCCLRYLRHNYLLLCAFYRCAAVRSLPRLPIPDRPYKKLMLLVFEDNGGDPQDDEHRLGRGGRDRGRRPVAGRPHVHERMLEG